MTAGDVPPTVVDRDACAVLVVDKQGAYFTPGLSPFLEAADAARVSERLRRIDAFVTEARALGVPVLWTLMTEDPVTSPPNLALVMGDEAICRAGTRAWELAGAQPDPGEQVFDKRFPDAFTGTDLEEVLRAQRRSTLVLVGGLAGRCVLATAFAAVGRGLHVVVPAGLVLGHDDATHEEDVVRAVVSTAIGWVVDPDELCHRWRAHRDRRS